MYHGVDNQQTDIRLNNPSTVVSKNNFEKQINYLSKFYKILSLEDLTNHIKKKIPFPSNSVIITFDDGLKNNFTNAFPILQKYNTTATIFLTTDYIDTLEITWFNKFSYFINKIGLSEFVEEFKRKFPEHSNLIGDIGQNKIIDLIISKLKYNVDGHVREEFIQSLFNKFRIKINKGKIKGEFLSWKEIKEMVDAGISFGAHTSTHPVLSTLNYENAKKEIVDSKKKIEVKLDKEVNLFAYPYGKEDTFDLNTKNILVNSNFLCAVSTINGLNNLNSDLFTVKRIRVLDEDFYYFKLRIEGFAGFIEKNYQKLCSYFKK